MTIGLEHMRRRTGSIVHDVGALMIAALTLCGHRVRAGLGAEPAAHRRNRSAVRSSIWSCSAMACPPCLPLCWRSSRAACGRRNTAPSAAVIAVALALAYLTLEVRTLFHGEVLTRGPTTDAERYTYSAVWLAFGVALLAAGMWLRSQAVRLASAAVVILTVLKVFLLDMAGLTGIWQSLSFIGLGAVLLGIGWLYQRLLFPRRATPAGG